MRVPAIAVLIAGCSSGVPATALPSGTYTAPRSTRSCPVASLQHSPAKLLLRQWVGRVGDRSWLLTDAGGHVALATLGDSGELVVTELPVSADLIATTAVDGKRLWMVADTSGMELGHQSLYSIDVDGPVPKVGPKESLHDNLLAGVDSFAIGTTRALFFTFAGMPHLQLWDREHAKPLGPTLALATVDSEPPWIRCLADRCFAIAVPGDGPTRRLTSMQFDPTDGHVQAEQLAGDHLADDIVIPVGDQTIVVWTSYSRRGMFARLLDASGHPLGDEVMIDPDATDPQVVTGPVPQLAFEKGDPSVWYLATLSSDLTLGPAQTLGLPEAAFLIAVTTGDGALAVGFSSGTDYDGSSHSWSAAGSAVFAPTGQPPEAAIGVMPRRTGAGMGGYAAFPLVSPGYAAALLVPQSDDPGGELVLLRQPCR